MSSKTINRPPDTVEQRPGRVSFPDRVALRIGMALIIWSRRTRRERPSLDHEAWQARQRALAEREALIAAIGMQANRWR